MKNEWVGYHSGNTTIINTAELGSQLVDQEGTTGTWYVFPTRPVVGLAGIGFLGWWIVRRRAAGYN